MENDNTNTSDDIEQKKANNLLKSLKTDEKSIFYAVSSISKALINRAKKSNYAKDKVFVNIYKNLKDKNLSPKESLPVTTPFVEQKQDVDRSTLYSFKAPFEALQVDIADIRFLARSAVDPHYCLVIVDMFSNMIYTYPMKKRYLLADKLRLFYESIKSKRTGNMRLQTDLEFQQNKIKNLNEEFNVTMYSSKIREGKAFAAERAIRDFKKILLRSKRIEQASGRRIKPYNLIKKATNNLNNKVMLKYGVAPKEIEQRSLDDENYAELFDFKRLYEVGIHNERLQRYNEKITSRKQKLRDPLEVGEKVLVLASRIRKKDAPGKLYKSSTENQPYFNRKEVFTIVSRAKIDGIYFYWVNDLDGRLPREELFALNKQFQ